MNEKKEIEQYIKIFNHITQNSELNNTEFEQISKQSYFNLNSLKGDSKLSCLFPNCKNKGVVKSHLFAESMIRPFSKNNKFITKSFFPNDLLKIKPFQTEELGINNSLTFPGFCKECEQKFIYERNRKMITPDDYLLQLLRSACYDIRISEGLKLLFEKCLENIDSRTSKKAAIFFNPAVSKIKLSGANIDAIKNLKNEILKKNKLFQNQLKRYYKVCRIYNGEIKSKIIVIEIKLFIPIFLSYSGSLIINSNNKITKGNVILNISPIDNKNSEIIILNLSNNFRVKLLKEIIESDVITFLLNMLNLSDNWLINKDFWDNNITKEAKEKILQIKKGA